MNANIQYVIQNLQMIFYLVQEYRKENVFHQITVLVIQDIIHLIVHYILVMVKHIMIQRFVLEMVIVLQMKSVIAVQDGNMKIVKLLFVIQYLLILHQ
jgi:hypothetical protein